MLFADIDHGSRDIIGNALKGCPMTSCELSCVIQQHYYGASWCQEDGFIVIKNSEAYLQPLGKGDLSRTVHMMKEDAEKEGRPMSLVVTDRERLPELRALLPDYGFFARREESDYIYSVDDIADLAGKHYRHERESLHRLLAEHECTIKDLAPEMIEECMDLLLTWESEYASMHNGAAHFRRHTEYIRSCLEDFAELEGIAVFSGGKLIGYTFGSDIGHGTFCDHVEVYDRSIEGLSVFLKHSLSARLKGRYLWIDMEDDMGLKGLRTFKMRLHPKEIRPILRMEKMAGTMLKVRDLWLEAFHDDSPEYAEQFLLTVFKEENMVAEYENGRLISMLHIIPFKDAAYIYACATAENRRGKGIFRGLMKKAADICRERGFGYMFLIPESEDLYQKVYSRLGFSGRFPVTFPSDFAFDPGTGNPDTDIACALPLNGTPPPKRKLVLQDTLR